MQLAALLLLCAPALGQDVWVDPINGSNANGGTSANDAFATITFALQTLGPGLDGVVDRVSLLPGFYSTTSGETWPLMVRREIELFGVAGPAQTTLRGFGNGTGTIVQIDSNLLLAPSLITGVTIQRARYGVSSSLVDLTLTECIVEDCTYGVWQDLFCAFRPSYVRLERCTVRDCDTGVRSGGCDFIVGSCTLLDSQVLDCGTGVSLFHNGDSIFGGAAERSRFEGCTLAVEVVNSSQYPQQMFELTTSVITGCVRGIDSVGGGLVISGSTIAANSGDGVNLDPAGYNVFGRIDGSIIYGNFPDIGGAPWSADYSNFGNATILGGSGNVSIDPLFRDAPNGDLRLGFGTACVDGGNWSGADLVGTARDIDGNLDLVGAPDMGALELLPLSAPETVQPGATLVFELHGPANQYAWLRLSRGGVLAVPQATPFGDLWLDTNQVETIDLVRTTAGAPELTQFQVPANQALIGLTVGLQSLVRSPTAPAGAAYSQPILVEIVQ